MNKVGKLFKTAGMGLKKFGRHKKPEICMVVGGVLGAATIVTACYQTYKGLPGIIDEHAKALEKVKANKEAAKDLPDDDPLKKKVSRETAIVYGTTALKCARLYALPLTTFGASMFMFVTAHKTMKIRNAGLAAAVAGVRKQFKNYRKSVAEEIGEEAEQNLYFGVKTKTVADTEIDENGEEKEVVKTYDDVADGVEGSEFVKYFVKGNSNWDRSIDQNYFFLTQQQNRANDILRQKGEITLNEVYDLLGFKRTEAGMVFGWIHDKENPFGDNKVEFILKRVHVPNEDGHGYSMGYAVDFNVDGNIYEEKKRRNGLRSFRKR